jgi:succinate dehydrogenase / fumarate reductase cytochrome b subunit
MLMAVTGLGMIGFLAVHLLGNMMAFAGAGAFNNYAKKLHSLEPYFTVFNIGLLTIGVVHISHGFWSLFQTFGINHPRHMPLIMKLGLVVTLVFGIGFGILPIYLLIIA